MTSQRSTDALVPGVSLRVHRLEDLFARLQVVHRVEVLNDDRGPLVLVVDELDAGRGHALRRPVGLIDALPQRRDALLGPRR